MRGPAIRSRIALALLAVFVAAIMAVTLTPSEAQYTTAFGCLICGERGLADAILNVILFLPVGILAAATFGATPRIAIAAAGFSAGIEAAQFFIPGRDASAGDLLFNTLGALAGLALAAGARHWAAPRPRARKALAAALAALVIATGAAGGRLVVPVFSDRPWFDQHTPDLPHLERYDGTVLDARVDDVVIPGGGRMPDALRDSVRSRIAAGGTVRVRLVVGSTPRRPAGFVTIYDDARQEMLLVGAIGDDLTMRVRIAAEEVRLDKPYPRLVGALARAEPGDTVEVTGRLHAGGTCLGIADEETCGIGMDAAGTWRILYTAETLPAWFRALVRLGWMAGLAALPGFYARDRISTAIGAAGVAVALLGVPALLPVLQATPPAALLAALVGFVAGAACGRLAERALSRPAAATP